MLWKTVAIVTLLAYGCVAPPVDELKKKKKDKSEETENELDSQAFDVEYKRYLEEVVSTLENDEEFKARLMKANPDDIKSGKISKELEFVSHNVRSKLDELKRQELERLRQAAVRQYEQSHGIDKKHLKMPGHLDPKNPYTFESEDLRKLIIHTAKELEDADRRRKEDFKEYEMQKELEYQEQLKHMAEQDKIAAQKQHEQLVQKHKKHEPLHHPGSKQQLEEVWEEQDHMSPDDFNPKTFFHLHDLDGNGVLDANEVKALFKKELDKMYDPNMPEDDARERYEEMERMREHVFNETDTNRDQLISFDEFMEQTRKQDFQRDEGWKGLDEQEPYSPEEYQQYARAHEEEVRRMYEQGLIPPAPPGYVPLVVPPGQQVPQGLHHQPVYQVPPGGHHPNEIPQGASGYHHQGQPQYQAHHPQQGQFHPQQGQFQPQQGQFHPQQAQFHPQQGQFQQPGGYPSQVQGGGHPQYQQQGSHHDVNNHQQQQQGSYQQHESYNHNGQQPGSYQQSGSYQPSGGQAAGHHQANDPNSHATGPQHGGQAVPPNTNYVQGQVPPQQQQHYDQNQHYQPNHQVDSQSQNQHAGVSSSTTGNVPHPPVNSQGSPEHLNANNQVHPPNPLPPQGSNSQHQPSH